MDNETDGTGPRFKRWLSSGRGPKSPSLLHLAVSFAVMIAANVGFRLLPELLKLILMTIFVSLFGFGVVISIRKEWRDRSIPSPRFMLTFMLLAGLPIAGLSCLSMGLTWIKYLNY